jgi:hypothetical protein
MPTRWPAPCACGGPSRLAVTGALRPWRALQACGRDVDHVDALLCGALRRPSSTRPDVHPIDVVAVAVITWPQTTSARSPAPCVRDGPSRPTVTGALRTRRTLQARGRNVDYVDALLFGALRRPKSARPVAHPIDVVDVIAETLATSARSPAP